MTHPLSFSEWRLAIKKQSKGVRGRLRPSASGPLPSPTSHISHFPALPTARTSQVPCLHPPSDPKGQLCPNAEFVCGLKLKAETTTSRHICLCTCTYKHMHTHSCTSTHTHAWMRSCTHKHARTCADGHIHLVPSTVQKKGNPSPPPNTQVQRPLTVSVITPECSVQCVSSKGQAHVFARPQPIKNHTRAWHLPQHSHRKRKSDPKVPDFSRKQMDRRGSDPPRPSLSRVSTVSAAPAYYWFKQVNMW